ncbi:MAG: exodeoxyribonuclease V subunit beta [Planctomycetota bacterium]|nr:MAG: exodeoxyribonuclease V subunit beta [Planctomycetota bacterium]
MTVQNFDAVATPISTGMMLLEASAGTGKTFTITRVVLRLLLEGKASRLDRVLIVTFTKAATEELSLRIRATLRQAVDLLDGKPLADANKDADLQRICAGASAEAADRVRQALHDFDQAQILTLHSFCKSVLEDQAFESGMPFGVELLSDVRPQVEELAFDFWRRRFQGEEDAPLGRLAAIANWSCTDLVEDWRRVRSRAALRLAPEPMAFAEALAGWNQAVASCTSLLDEAFFALFAAVKGVQNLQKAGGKALHLRRLRDLPAGAGSLGLASILLFGSKPPEEWFGKSKPAKPLCAHPFFAACGDCARAAALLEHALRAEFFAAMDRGYRESMRAQASLGFDDLLLNLREALNSEASDSLIRAVRARFDAALIDEFQDTDPVQFEILQKLFAGKPMLLIGDPKQSIYGFRGADIFAYLQAKELASEAFGLGGNWRSHPRLVAALGHLFGGHLRPFLLRGLDFVPVQAMKPASDCLLTDGRPELCMFWLPRYVPDDKDKLRAWSKGQVRQRIPEEIAAECARLLRENPHLRPKDLAILIRSNSEAAPMQAALQAHGIPSVLSRAADVFHSEEAWELELLLRAMLSPMRLGSVGLALSTRILGWEAAALAELLKDEDGSLAMMQSFAEREQEWREHGVFYACEELFEAHVVRARLLSRPLGERSLTNLVHLMELLHSAERSEELSPEALLDWLARQRSEHPRGDESRELRLERDDEAVQILTVHASKGLEYEVLFCPSLWDGVDRDKESVLVHEDEELIYDFASGPLASEEGARRRRRARAERLAEDMRLVYVALTRAKSRCYLCWGVIGGKQHGGSENSALGWLFHLRDHQPHAGESLEDYVERGMASLKEGVPNWENEVKALIEGAGVEIGLETLDPEPRREREIWCPETSSSDQLKARTLSLAKGQLDCWRIASFSSLTASGLDEAEETLDHDAELLIEDAPAEGIFAFARGARPGTVLHAILERADLREPRSPQNLALVAAELEAAGLDRPGAHRGPLDPAETLMCLLERLGSTQIPALGFALGDLAPERCFAEWQFWLPLRPGAPRRIAAIYQEYARSELERRYGQRLQQLSEQELGGFLTGFVDLLFEHEGRMYVLDWKSNWLGNRPEAYGQAGMEQAMREHDYLLQSLLYQLAVARHLRTRVPDLDLEQALGGSCYVYLRGVDAGGQRGFFYERAAPELLLALEDELLGKAGARVIGVMS